MGVEKWGMNLSCGFLGQFETTRVGIKHYFCKKFFSSHQFDSLPISKNLFFDLVKNGNLVNSGKLSSLQYLNLSPPLTNLG